MSGHQTRMNGAEGVLEAGRSVPLAVVWAPIAPFNKPFNWLMVMSEVEPLMQLSTGLSFFNCGRGQRSALHQTNRALLPRFLPGQGGADDAGVIAHPGRDDLGAGLDIPEPFAGLLAHAAAEDDQLG